VILYEKYEAQLQASHVTRVPGAKRKKGEAKIGYSLKIKPKNHPNRNWELLFLSFSLEMSDRPSL
jgi:hypothetical protein